MGKIPHRHGENSPPTWGKFPTDMGKIPHRHGENSPPAWGKTGDKDFHIETRQFRKKIFTYAKKNPISVGIFHGWVALLIETGKKWNK